MPGVWKPRETKESLLLGYKPTWKNTVRMKLTVTKVGGCSLEQKSWKHGEKSDIYFVDIQIFE